MSRNRFFKLDWLMIELRIIQALMLGAMLIGLIVINRPKKKPTNTGPPPVSVERDAHGSSR